MASQLCVVGDGARDGLTDNQEEFDAGVHRTDTFWNLWRQNQSEIEHLVHC